MAFRLLAAGVVVAALGLLACADRAPTRAWAPAPVDGGPDGDAAVPAHSPISMALCDGALRYKQDCNPGLYYASCEALFQQLDSMDPVAQEATTACFHEDCEAASLGKCLAAGIAAVEPSWIDGSALHACAGQENACELAARGDLATCIATATGCDSSFGVSYCWNVALLTEDRRRAAVACPASSCGEWVDCVADEVYREPAP